MRIALPIDWNLEATSLTNIVRNQFREIGKIMNETKSFTITATKIESASLGDFNQHFDLLHIANIGGYRFPLSATKHCKNIICGLVGIDEVIYGKDVLAWKESWKVVKPLIDQELEYWKKYNDKISMFHVGTKSEQNEMNEYLHIPFEKLEIIPLGVDHDFFKSSDNKEICKQVLSELNIPNEKYFLHIGEINYARKNLSRLGKAFSLAKKSGLKHNLIIGGKHLPQIEKELKDVPGIYFLDWLTNEQLLKLFQGADGFVLPSIHEGFGLPLVEAMCCGIPCITSNRHSPPHLLDGAGILVDPTNVSEICDAMLKLVNDPVLHTNLSNKSLERSKFFSWKKYADQIVDLYQINLQNPMTDFNTHYELAAYRTLVTVCDLFPDKDNSNQLALLTFDYKKLIQWAIDYGLHDSKIRDFLIPFEQWFHEKLSELSK